MSSYVTVSLDVHDLVDMERTRHPRMGDGRYQFGPGGHAHGIWAMYGSPTALRAAAAHLLALADQLELADQEVA